MAKRQHRSPTIFVVGGDFGTRLAWQRRFRAAGCSVEAYPSARAFLARAEPARPGLLLLDALAAETIAIAVQAARLERPDDRSMALRTGSRSGRSRPVAPRGVDPRQARVCRIEVERRQGLLTPREREVMTHVVGGKTSKAIGRALGVSHRTVEIHRTRVMAKMQASSLAELIGMASAHGPA